MKTISSIFFVALLCTSSGIAQAQDSTADLTKSSIRVIKVSPFHFIDNTLQMEYERIPQRKGGTGLNVTLGMTSGQFDEYDNYSYYDGGGNYYSRSSYADEGTRIGFHGELQLRKYISTGSRNRFVFKIPRLYMGLFSKYRYMDLSNNSTSEYYSYSQQNSISIKRDDHEVQQTIHAGILIGMHVMIGKYFYVDVATGGGPNYKFRSGNYRFGETSIFDSQRQGITPRFNLAFGFSLDAF